VLETLFRTRFYLVHLALTALLAVLLARVTTSIAARVLVEKLASTAKEATAKPVPRAPSAPPRDFVGLANANIFDGRREITIDEPTSTDAPAASTDVGDWRNAPRSSLKLRLVGTMAFSEPTLSLCSIVEEGANAKGADLYSINACAELDISGLSPEDQKLVGKPAPCNKVAEVAIVKRIEPELVYIWNVADSRVEFLALNEPPAPTGAAKVAAKTETPEKTEDSGDGIVKTGDNRFGVPRSTVDNALNNLSQLATEARVVPAFEGGKPVGFKLFSIKPGSLYSKIGLQNGDVINRINGYEMSSPEKGLEVYQKLKDSANITVDVKRRGKGMTLDYTIQ
jgi:general secretion pathway protein C